MSKPLFRAYADDLSTVVGKIDWTVLEPIAHALVLAWKNDSSIFICGNGGSGGNANHLATDFVWGVAPNSGKGMRAQALTANSSVLTCLANDISYEESFAEQVRILGRPRDVLIVMSGSGNSPNILRAIQAAQEKQITTIGFLGFDGGKALEMVDLKLHFPINDMQISEDLQQVAGHMLTRWLNENYEAALSEVSLDSINA
ncbi:MAG: SIS domain-containing protein [Opitutales bacterium]